MGKQKCLRCLESLAIKKWRVNHEIHYPPTNICKIKSLSISNVGKAMEKLEFSHIIGRKTKW